jgi:hypothetical protein
MIGKFERATDIYSKETMFSMLNKRLSNTDAKIKISMTQTLESSIRINN